MTSAHRVPERRIFVAIPTADGSIKVSTANCVMDALVDALIQGWAFTVKPYSAIAPIAAARNWALAEFLSEDFTDLVYIDDDVAWEPGALVKLIGQPVDFVAGIYPHRADRLSFPIQWDSTKPILQADPKTGLLEVHGVPFGFVRLTRAAVLRMVEAHKDLLYEEAAAPNGKVWDLFDHIIIDGRKWSEDFLFCKRWRDSGGRVWVDPEIRFTHTGDKAYGGHLGDWLRARRDAAP